MNRIILDPAPRVRGKSSLGFLVNCQNADRHAYCALCCTLLPGSGSERSPPNYGNRGARVYNRGASRALGAIHEGGAVLAEAPGGEPP